LPKDVVIYKRSKPEYFYHPNLSLFKWSGNKTDYRKESISTLDIAARLAKNPRDPLALISLADFTDEFVYDTILSAKTSQFPGNEFSNYEAYKIIIADKSAPPEIKAYALYRAIYCYARSGYNHCGGTDEPLSVRTEWFRLLKSRYKDSVWAKKLKYYW
jgi:hypothetical protein